MKVGYHITRLFLRREEIRTLTTNEEEYGILLCSGEGCCAEWEDQCVTWGREDLLLMQPKHKVQLYPRKQKAPPQLTWLRVEECALQALSDEKTDLLASFEFLPFGCAVVPAGAQTAMMTYNLCNRLMTEAQNPGYGDKIMERGILQTLLILVLRAGIQADLGRDPQKRARFMLDDVFIYLKKHFTEKLTLHDLENVFYVSHEHIAREFKRQTGQTIHQYILTMRIERACELLRKGQCAAKVWEQCGFESRSYFFQAFHRCCGMTPKEYVKKVKEEQKLEEKRREQVPQPSLDRKTKRTDESDFEK